MLDTHTNLVDLARARRVRAITVLANMNGAPLRRPPAVKAAFYARIQRLSA